MKEEEDQDRMSGLWGRSPQASRGSLLVSGGQHSCHTVLSCSVQESRQPRESVQRQGHDESDGGPTLGKCSVRLSTGVVQQQVSGQGASPARAN